MRVKRRDLLRSLLAAPFVAPLLRAGKARAATPPNVILLIFDDMTFEQMRRMPQLMKLGLTGVNFLNAYASTAICQTARMTFLTGQYSHNHGLVDNGLTGYPVDHSTMLPRRLQLAGYQTCHIGKYLNAWDIANPIPAGWNEWHQIAPQKYYGYSINDDGVTTTPPDYNTTICNKRALSFIGSATEPFFMQIGYKAPHYDQPSADSLNATPAPEYSGIIPGSRTAPRNPNFNVPMGTPPAYMSHAAMDGTKTNSVDAFWRGQTEMLFSVDQSIQAIRAALAAAGKTNTVIIAVSDNGYFHGEGRDPAEKIAPYLPALRVPLIISGPSSLVAQGKICTQLVSHIDLAATIFALSGATPGRALDGVSLTPLLANPAGAALRNHLLLEFLGIANTGWGVTVPVCHSLLSPSYLYTTYATAEQELYDLVADPFQLTNQAAAPAYASIRAAMASRLSAVQACSGGSCAI